MGHQYNNQHPHPPSTSDVFDIWSNQNQKQGAPQSSCDQQHNNSQQEVLPMHQPLQLQSSSQYTPTPPRTIRKLYDTTTSSTSPPPQSTVNQLRIPPNSTSTNSTHTNNNNDNNIVGKNRSRLNTSEESHTTTTKEQHNKQQAENEEDLVNQLRKELAECQAELLEVRARAGTASPSIALPGSRISSPIPIMGGNSAIPLNSPIIPTTTTTNNRSRLNTADNSTTIPVLGSRSRLNTSESISIPQSPNIPQSVPIVQHTAMNSSAAESMNINRVRLNTGESSDNMQSCTLQQHQTRSRLDTTDSEALTVPVFNSASSTSQYNIGGGQIDDSRRTQRVSNRTNNRTTALDLLNVDNYNEAANNVVYLQPTPVAANKRTGYSNLMKESVPPLPLVDTVHNEKVDDGFDDDDSVDYFPDKGIEHKNPVLQLNEENKIIVNNELRTTGGNNMEEKKDFTSIIDQMKLFPPPPPKNNYDDGASDVSSLTDAVSYQTSPKLKGRKSSTSITSEGEKQQQSAGVGSTMMAMAALSLRKKKPKNIQRASTSHTLETIDNSMEQNLYDAASSSSRQRREHLFPSRRGRQHQMRLSLPLEGHWGGGSFAHPMDDQHNKPQVIFPSPLSEAIERESRLSLSTTGSLGSSKQQHRRVQSSMEDLTRKFNSHHLQQHKQHHHYRSASNGSTSIQSSWLIPTADQPESSARHNESPGTQGTQTTTQMTDEATNTTIPTIQLPPLQTATIGRPEDDDLIDISYDVPIDPFSGLIGMPKSSGDSIGSGDVPSVEPLLWDNMFGGSTRNHTNSSSSRPPIGKQRSKSVASSSLVVDEFDPLLLANINESEEMTSVHSNSVSSMSPLRSSAVPPRHYKDDPLLSKSKYRHPLLISGQLQQQQQQQQSNNHRPSTVEKKTKKKRHQRSSSLGASITNSNLGNACMFGTIAQLEAYGTHPTESMVITTASMSRNVSCASLDWDGSVTSLTDQNSVVGHGSVVAATTGLSQLHATPKSDGAEEEGASSSSFVLRTPDSVQDLTVVNIVPPTNLVDNKDECNTNTVNDDDDGENSSYGSFSEEYHRPEQKHKGVVREVKHIMKPMVKVGRKLLGRGSDDASMKRADGCLT